MTQTRWYVVETRPHAEQKASAHLRRQGFDVYLPRHLKKRRHARRTEMVARPLFPRYLFVAVDITAQRWRSIQSTVGVLRFVCNGDVPTAVPNGIVDAIKTREKDGFVRLDKSICFRSGDAVRVAQGVFAANFGIVEGATDGERVMILLDLLGRKVRVNLEVDLLAAA